MLRPEDRTVIQGLAEGSFVPRLASEYGNEASAAMRLFFESIRRAYEACDELELGGSLTIYCPVRALETPTLQLFQIESFDRLRDYIADSMVVETAPGRLSVAVPPDGFDPGALAASSLTYHRDGDFEVFLCPSGPIPVPRMSTGSLFAVPAFRELSVALDRYAVSHVRTSHCRVFAGSWTSIERVFFRPSPESTMRRSLAQFLLAALREVAEIRPEQIVDETHPVDIKVTFNMSRRIGLVEIKWLGKSVNEEGSVTADWGPARANEGAQQLADYLDRNRGEDALSIARGYLVVIDGRRRRPTLEAPMSSADKSYYATREIAYDPPHHERRFDFELPKRMFAEAI